MGLSASQARLLSITRRLNNNELQSEFIANSKIRLSSQNVTASEKYIAALDATKLDYISYNDSGVEQTVALTFNALNNYDPLKNQYAIYNAEGQLYVSATDAANFRASNNLHQFLEKYHLFDQSDAENDAADAAYEADFALWEQERDAYDAALKAYQDKTSAEWVQYLSDKAEWEAEQWTAYTTSPEYQAYEAAQTAFETTGGLYNTFIGIVDGNSHYVAAQRSDPGCFLHVLDNLLYNVTTCNTTTGANLTSLWQTSTYYESDLHAVADIMNDSTLGAYCVCDGKDVGAPEGKNLYQYTRENGQPITDLIKLASDYIEVDNGDGTYSYNLKTLKQKTIDMYYLIYNSNEMYTTRSGEGSNLWALSALGVTVKDFLVDYVEGDMTQLDPEQPPYNPEPFPQPEPTFEEVLRDPPDEPIETDRIYDKPKAQWYTNLWYAMNGQSTSDEVYTIYDENGEFSYYSVENPDKICDQNTSNNNYVVIDDTLASDSSWLQFALTNGMVTISQAGLRSNSEITWEGIEFTSTSDISEVPDESKIAKAEAEYEKTMQEIQIEDKKLERQMTKLDTEHSALEKELESIKGVMDKNTERSFAAFS